MGNLLQEFVEAIEKDKVGKFAEKHGWKQVVDDFFKSGREVSFFHRKIASLVLAQNRSQGKKEELETKIPTLITKTITRVNPEICQSTSVGVVLYYPDGTFQKIPTFSDCIEQSEHSIRDWLTAHINAVMEKES